MTLPGEVYSAWQDAALMAVRILERDGIRHLLGTAFTLNELEEVGKSVGFEPEVIDAFLPDWKWKAVER
jgi:hypothetical protein